MTGRPCNITAVMWTRPALMRLVTTWVYDIDMNGAEFLELGWHRTLVKGDFIAFSWYKFALDTVEQKNMSSRTRLRNSQCWQMNYMELKLHDQITKVSQKTG